MCVCTIDDLEEISTLHKNTTSPAAEADLEPKPAAYSGGEEEALFLTLTYSTEYDAVRFPFGCTPDPEYCYDPEMEVDRLRGVVNTLLNGEGGEVDGGKVEEVHNLSSPSRSAHNAAMADLSRVRRQYDSLKSSSSKRILRLERQLRATAYASSGRDEVGRVRDELRVCKGELAKEKRKGEKVKEVSV